jgi:hypothetical protein
MMGSRLAMVMFHFYGLFASRYPWDNENGTNGGVEGYFLLS